MICLSRESMEKAFQKYLECLFELQEIKSARVRDITIDRENMGLLPNGLLKPGITIASATLIYR